MSAQVTDAERHRSPRRGLCAAILSLEAVTLGLTTPVMISVAHVPAGRAAAGGLGLALVCVVLAGSLRHPVVYWLGWLVQVAALALGVVVPLMWVLGVVCTALWAGADLLGRKIERERAAAFAAYDAQREAQRDR